MFVKKNDNNNHDDINRKLGCHLLSLLDFGSFKLYISIRFFKSKGILNMQILKQGFFSISTVPFIT